MPISHWSRTDCGVLQSLCAPDKASSGRWKAVFRQRTRGWLCRARLLSHDHSQEVLGVPSWWKPWSQGTPWCSTMFVGVCKSEEGPRSKKLQHPGPSTCGGLPWGTNQHTQGAPGPEFSGAFLISDISIHCRYIHAYQAHSKSSACGDIACEGLPHRHSTRTHAPQQIYLADTSTPHCSHPLNRTS